VALLRSGWRRDAVREGVPGDLELASAIRLVFDLQVVLAGMWGCCCLGGTGVDS